MNRRDFCRGCLGGLAATFGAGRIAGSEVMGMSSRVDAQDMACKAVEQFTVGGRGCAEAVLQAGCEGLGIDSYLIPDIAMGLVGGVGMPGRTCGAVTGAALVLSLAAAARQNDYKKKAAATARATDALCRQFENAFQSTDCRELLGLDLRTPQGRAGLTSKVRNEKCAMFVDTAARMLAARIEAMDA